MSLTDLNIPAEVLAEAESMMTGGYLLTVPEGTERKNNFYARFSENVVIESATHDQETASNGASRYVFTLKYKVLPSGLNGDVNAGKVITEFMRYNFGALAGKAEAVGNGSMDGEKKMSTMTAGKLKQLAVAAGFPLEEGLTGEIMSTMFPSKILEMPPEEDDVLPGMKFVFTILDNSDPKRQFNGKNNQGIDSIAPLEGDDA